MTKDPVTLLGKIIDFLFSASDAQFCLQTYYKDYLKLCRLYGVETPVIDDEELDENGEVKNKK